MAREKGPFSFFIGPPGTGSNARSPALQVRLISVWWTVGRAIDDFNTRISVDSLARVSARIVRDVFFRNIGLLGKDSGRFSAKTEKFRPCMIVHWRYRIKVRGRVKIVE